MKVQAPNIYILTKVDEDEIEGVYGSLERAEERLLEIFENLDPGWYDIGIGCSEGFFAIRHKDNFVYYISSHPVQGRIR